MQKLAGNSVEVLNGAVTGYGTDQELLWLIEYGLKYSPDIVILGVFPLAAEVILQKMRVFSLLRGL